MQMHAQINNKTHWIVSATLLLVTLCTVILMAFSPSVAPKAHAVDINLGLEKWKASYDLAVDTIVGIPQAAIDMVDGGKKAAGNYINKKTENLLDDTLGNMFEWLTKNIAWLLSTLFFGVAVWMLDAAIVLSLDSNLINSLTAINDGWGLVRDVCNMFFIFILLYIAIATILQATTFNWKKTLGNLIIAALLINFSLFFTKVIIDISNVFAVTFHNSMKVEINGKIFYGPGTILEEGLGLETAFTSIDEQSAIGDKRVELTHMTRGIIWIFGSIFNMVAGFVFFAGAFIFIKRTLAFIFLMIFSPIGFIGFVLPATKKFSDMWWKALTENAVIAPVFLFMLYLVCNIVRSGNLVDISQSDKTALALAFTGETAHYTIILQFILLIGLMWGALIISQAVSNATASSSIRFAGRMTGGMLAGGAMVGRQVGGKAGRMVTESNRFKRLAESDNKFARRAGSMILQGGDAAAKSSWDARNTKAGGAMIGGFKEMSSATGTGSISVGAGQDRGKGGIVAAEEDRGKTRNARDKNLGNILATDKYGKFRKVEDPITGEKMTARELHSKRLERRAGNFEPDAEEPAFMRGTATSTRKYLSRHDAIADKKAAKLVGKGDKETKDAIKAEEISAIEKSLEEAIKGQDFEDTAKIMGDLTSDHIKDMDRKILVKPEVAIHLDIGGLKTLQKTATGSEREQIREAIEDSATNPTIVANSNTKRAAEWLNGPQGGNEF